MSSLIQRLRSMRESAIESDNAERPYDSPSARCVFVDMRPVEFHSTLREAEKALEMAHVLSRVANSTMDYVIELKEENETLKRERRD